MPRRPVIILAAMLFLAACRVAPPPAKAPRPAASVPVRTASDRLLEPATTHGHVKGQVRIDAGYLLASRQGRLDPQGLAVLAGDAIVSNNGAGVISNNGGSIISDHGGGLIADPASGKLTDAAEALFAAADGAILSNNGGAIISDHGGAIISDHGAAFGLLAAAAPALGRSLPAAGMQVLVLDLRTGRALPVGVDAAGKPVHVVLTDAAGRYELYLPDGLSPNVRVVTLPPGGTDARLVYNLVAAARQAEEAIDEGTAGASRLLRLTFSGWLADKIRSNRDVLDVPNLQDAQLAFAILPLATAAADAKVAELEPARLRRVLQATADALIAYLDLAGLETEQDEDWPAPPEPALGAVGTILNELETAAAAKLQADPHAFDRRPFFLDANMRRARAGKPPYVLVKPTDLSALILDEYLIPADLQQREQLRFVLADLGLPTTEFEHLRAAYDGLLLGAINAAAKDEAAMGAAIAALQAASAVERARQEAAPASPVPTPTATPTPPWYQVATLTGAESGFQDGPAAEARFGRPCGMDFDDAGHLYLADYWNHRIRVIDTADPARPVTSIGLGTPGHQDGPADQATFETPGMVRYDAKAHPPALYVSQGDAKYGGQRVRRISFPPGRPPVVDTLAGDGTAGYQDGPGLQARFGQPGGLVADGKGHLYVADRANHRVRRIDLDDPAHPVTTVAGSGADLGFVLGDPMKATFRGPADVLVDPQGRLLIMDVQCLYRLTFAPTPSLTVVAGNRIYGEPDGYWAEAEFGVSSQIAFDLQGRVLVAEEGNNRIRRVDFAEPDAAYVTTVAGSAKAQGTTDGPGDQARFFKPIGIAVGRDGTVYVSDSENHRIRTLAGAQP
jgi:sugar lactone lactonase YvrE